LFWIADVEPVGIMPAKPERIGWFARAWLGWGRDPNGKLQAEAEWNDAMQSWGQAQSIGSVGFDDMVYVLSRSKDVSRERVLWLRNRIWWSLNDRFRDLSDDSPVPGVSRWPAAAERANMEVILAMLQDGEAHPGSMVQQGELLRLLGRFDEAIAILKAVPCDGHSEVRAVRIERLARMGDTQVRELIPPTL
jgi:hypothetical protein